MSESARQQTDQQNLLQDNGNQDPVDVLIRQVDSTINRERTGTNSLGPSVSYSKLYCLASGSDKTLLYFGWISAVVAGCGMPSFVFLIGDVIDSFDPSKATKDEMLDTISFMSLLFTMVGIGVWITSYIDYAFLLMFSERIAKKIRVAYLQAILRQESAWFDTINPSELSSRLGKEVLAIQKALGEKMGTIILAFSMTISGLAFAFSKGWSFSLVVLGSFPFVALSTSLVTKVMQSGFQENMKAYGQSAGYADQALNAIRVVVAYGQEVREVKNYSKYLERAKKAGIKTHCKGSITVACFMSSIFATYAYSFYLGSVFIYNDVRNDTYGRTYSAGDVLSVFFGVVFGMFSIGMATPNLKAVAEGKVAGKMAFDIIDRKPQIDQDTVGGQNLDNLKGAIEFKNVTFFYPSRPDNQILKNFSAKFELGKTTAIVGPSGSGKSTIVQLIERFYDPLEGQVLIDGVDLKTVGLRDFRRKVGYVGQEPILFNSTIKENILLGCPSATDEQIETALKKSNAWEFISKHEQGINLHVGAAGGQISGGQKQRVAIARAFIKNPKILIFDEATSALDKKNEKEVQASIDSIREELGQVTTVVIAHRLSTIKSADTILVMKKGKIVEQGNHTSLLREYPDGIYAQLVRQQEAVDDGEVDVKQNYDSAQTDSQLHLSVGEQENHAHYSNQKYSTGQFRKDNADDVSQASPSKYDALPMIKQPSLKQQMSRTSIKGDNTLKNKKQDEALLALEKDKKEVSDKVDNQEDNDTAELKKKLEKEGFFKRLSPYNKPFINIIIGIFVSCVQGCIFPVFGIFITRFLFALMNTDKEKLRDSCDDWALYMFICALVSLTTTFTQKFCFGIVGENITMNIRRQLYFSLLKKNIGWFDYRENAPGVLTSVLASDAQTLNGASTEGLAVILESLFALTCGIILGFVYSWKVSLVALGCVPFMMVGGSINAKFQAGMSDYDEASYKDANLLAGDAINNYRTVASFGYDDLLVKEYERYIDFPTQSALKKAHCIGFWFGFSQFVQNAVFALLYWAGAQFNYHSTDTSGENVFEATFAMMFGAFAAGQANQFGPDMGKAKRAGLAIFGFIDLPTKINAVDIPEDAIEIIPGEFRGEIEFRDVWFRYPTRKNEWVFKGLNLKIHPNESVAVVGESGSGKSTLVNLVLRFYDPNHGQVLIDGIDARRYNLRQLRMKMGLVMQEPTLFNYTIRENILYGKDDSCDSEVRDAAKVANALEFIESQELFMAYEDSAMVLSDAYNQQKEQIIQRLGQQKYEENIKILARLVKKEQNEGRFQGVKGDVDERDQSKKDLELHQGFDIQCGVKGGKLSGGQKQRIAIARAVVRKPNILILDEATSALDEESQRKVQLALDNIMVGRTSIVIAHRLTTVEKCSRIAVIENGQVAEQGKFTDLKNQEGGFFANLAAGMKKAEEKEKHVKQTSKSKL